MLISMLKNGDKYWYIDPDGELAENEWRDDSDDIWNWQSGNIYLTKMDALDGKANMIRLTREVRRLAASAKTYKP